MAQDSTDNQAKANLLEQIHTLVNKVAELELRMTNCDDEVKALSSRITQIEILASNENRHLT
jgi:hypothetical protein